MRWIAKTVKGDIRTNLPARGTLFGTTFRGSVNAPGGPTITTSSLMGNVASVRRQALGREHAVDPQRSARVVQSPAIVAGQQTSASGRGGFVRGTVIELGEVRHQSRRRAR